MSYQVDDASGEILVMSDHVIGQRSPGHLKIDFSIDCQNSQFIAMARTIIHIYKEEYTDISAVELDVGDDDGFLICTDNNAITVGYNNQTMAVYASITGEDKFIDCLIYEIAGGYESIFMRGLGGEAPNGTIN